MTEISGNARHAAIDALIEAGFVDPDDGTVPRWRDNEPVPVWTVPAQVVDVVLAAALPHLRAHQAQPLVDREVLLEALANIPVSYSHTLLTHNATAGRLAPHAKGLIADAVLALLNGSES